MDKSHLTASGHENHHGRSSPAGEAQPEAEGHEEFLSTHLPSRPVTPMGPERDTRASHRKPRKIVLCFDGTGNKFHGDDSDSNILKIFRMLNRTASDQYHYYQPGIGTYVVSNSLSHTSTVARIKSWYMKAKDSAVGSSFDQHVVGGYRFLMRFYNPGDEIYIFGFSRGAYIARFLAEMLDYVGLLSHGNEEMVSFAWKAFSNWQSRQGSTTPEGIKKKKEMYAFLKGFRETFSRPVRRIRFLGLFDTVNSVPRFETAWMERSKFPYTARTSAKVIRHAVSIDERRAKFRQDLIYQSDRGKKDKQHKSVHEMLHEAHEKYRRKPHGAPPINGAADNTRLSREHPDVDRGRRGRLEVPDDTEPYRTRSHSTRSRKTHATDDHDHDHGDAKSDVAPHPHDDDLDSLPESEDETKQDIDEVWFAGGHADIGGGWEMLSDSKAASHVPLVWMVHEAMKAGLHFDLDKVREMGCIDALDCQDTMAAAANDSEKTAGPVSRGTCSFEAAARPANGADHPSIPNIMIRTPSAGTPKLFQGSKFSDSLDPNEGATTSHNSQSGGDQHRPLSFKEMMHKAHCARIHDSLEFDCGLSWGSVMAWKIMEYLPFRRMDLQEDGSWKPIRWPLPCGEVRDIPENARVHGSVIRRMQSDENYRPGNLIIGGGGRGVRRAPKEHGIGEWICVAREGCPIGEIWMKKSALEKAQNGHAKGAKEKQ